ncbi:MAG TPA: hypothetical protein PLF35_14005, partial [Prolixibacteraceae bacterium]|nr:hypothetical protein [Prolixibacteraceae bacterium]
MNKLAFITTIFVLLLVHTAQAQCLSSMNPVGGAENLLSLEKNSFRTIVFYKGGGSNKYYTGNTLSDYNLIDRANYNSVLAMLGYGLSPKLTLEFETG